MKTDELFLVGKIVKPYGSQGELLIRLDQSVSLNLKISEPLFIEIDGKRVPFFIASLQSKPGTQIAVKFDDINSPDDAAMLLNRDVYFPAHLVSGPKGRKYRNFNIENYRVVDEAAGNIGFVKQVIDLTHQSLLSIDHDGKEILVPLVDQIVLEIDTRKKILYIRAPEGLLDIYI